MLVVFVMQGTEVLAVSCRNAPPAPTPWTDTATRQAETAPVEGYVITTMALARALLVTTEPGASISPLYSSAYGSIKNLKLDYPFT